MKQRESLLSPVWTHLTQIVPKKGEGIYLFDDNGDRYTDFTSGIGVINTGHCHPRIVEAIQNQANQLIFAQMNCTLNPKAIELAEKLDEITPNSLNSFFFSNSGAEATESAVKLAKASTGRDNIIVMQGSFHGRTHLSMAMTTSKTIYRKNYGPLPSGIFVTPFPYTFMFGWTEEETVKFCIRQLDLVLNGQTDPEETAAIIIEPVLGEGGYVPVPESFLRHLRAICDTYGILLIIDEVQSGFGRTGKMFCFEHFDLEPDILVMAKGLGSGMPISAVAANKSLMEKWPPGSHGGTYGGGNAIAAAAALATIDTLLQEDLIKNSAERGKQLQSELEGLQEDFPCLGDVRGLGLMVACEIVDSDNRPDATMTQRIIDGCLDKKLWLLTCGTYKNVIRWIPPLVVTRSQIEDSITVFKEVLHQINQEK
jgi:4-aminobutyrate aminotransferase